MKINSYCENSYSNDFILSTDEISRIANMFLEYALNNTESNFSKENDYQLEIMLCDNDFIHNINREYRQKDCPTDVITFALYNDSEDKVIVDNVISLGQILISCDKVFEQAKENNVTSEYEFNNLLAHGVLHLLGFDHLDNESLEFMLDLQNKMIGSVDNVKI